MSEQLDPKELKILSDILALVLDEQAGQASNALEAVRSRARRNAVTAGALKNLFVAIAPNPPRPRASRARSTGTTPKESPESRQRIMTLTEDLRQLDLDLRTSRARVEHLRSELHLTQAARAEMQSQLAMALSHARRPPRAWLVWVACTVGILLGIAGTQFVHSISDPRPFDKSLYLH